MKKIHEDNIPRFRCFPQFVNNYRLIHNYGILIELFLEDVDYIHKFAIAFELDQIR